MQKIKTQKGITLIALIITIIVMLILVAVTLVITLGENGIIAKAREASSNQQIEQERETLQDLALGAFDEKTMKVDETALKGNLPTGWQEDDGTYTSPNGNLFTVSEDGNVMLATKGGSGNKEKKDYGVPYAFTLNDLLENDIIYPVSYIDGHHEPREGLSLFGANLEELITYIGFNSLEEFQNSNYNMGHFVPGVNMFYTGSTSPAYWSWEKESDQFVTDKTLVRLSGKGPINEDPDYSYGGTRENTNFLLERYCLL